MKTNSTTFEKDGSDYVIKERASGGGSMYRVKASTEEEAKRLFKFNSHLVKFIGSVTWK